jgi:hypothetical protein
MEAELGAIVADVGVAPPPRPAAGATTVPAAEPSASAPAEPDTFAALGVHSARERSEAGLPMPAEAHTAAFASGAACRWPRTPAGSGRFAASGPEGGGGPSEATTPLEALMAMVAAQRREMRVAPLREEEVLVAGEGGGEGEGQGEAARRIRRVYPGGLVHVEGEPAMREEAAAETPLLSRARALYGGGAPATTYRGLLERAHVLGALPYRRLHAARTPLSALTPELRFHLACALAASPAPFAPEGYVEVPDPRGVVYEAAGRRYWVAGGVVPILCLAPEGAPGGLPAPEGAPGGLLAPEGAPGLLAPEGAPGGAALLAGLLRTAHLTPPAAWPADGPDLPESVPRRPLPMQVFERVLQDPFGTGLPSDAWKARERSEAGRVDTERSEGGLLAATTAEPPPDAPGPSEDVILAFLGDVE